VERSSLTPPTRGCIEGRSVQYYEKEWRQHQIGDDGMARKAGDPSPPPPQVAIFRDGHTRRINIQSAGGAILLVVSNEPELSYLRATARKESQPAIQPTLFRHERVLRELDTVHGRNTEQRAAGKSVVLLTGPMAARRLTTPTMLCAINSLEPGGDQRPHKHSSAALTLSIDGEGVYTLVDGVKIAWEADTLIVTPPFAVHSHHNRGKAMMRSFVAQDTGLYTEMRTISFAWTDV